IHLFYITTAFSCWSMNAKHSKWTPSAIEPNRIVKFSADYPSFKSRQFKRSKFTAPDKNGTAPSVVDGIPDKSILVDPILLRHFQLWISSFLGQNDIRSKISEYLRPLILLSSFAAGTKVVSHNSHAGNDQILLGDQDKKFTDDMFSSLYNT